MDWDSKLKELKELTVESYRTNGFGVSSLKSSFIENGVYDLSLGISLFSDYLADLSFGVRFLKRNVSIYNLEVNDSVRRKGHGRKIVSSLEDVFREFNFSQVSLVAKDRNSQKFWNSLGYVPVSSSMIKFL